jgi:hypothetical protein
MNVCRKGHPAPHIEEGKNWQHEWDYGVVPIPLYEFRPSYYISYHQCRNCGLTYQERVTTQRVDGRS